MLGHADPAMTLRRYAHVLEDMEDEGARAILIEQVPELMVVSAQ